MSVSINYSVAGGGGGGGASSFSALTGAPTDNATLSSSLSNKLSIAAPWNPATNDLGLASGVNSNGGAVYSSAAQATAITVPITTTIYPNDWLIFTPSVSQWVQVSYLQNIASAPDLATADLSNNATIQTINSNISSNTSAISNIKPLPTATTYSTTWDTTSTKDMGDVTVSGAINITTSSVGGIPGGYTQATFIADGTNAPTVNSVAISGYTNTNGTRNRVKVEQVGTTLFVSCIAGGIASTKGAFAMPTITGSPTPVVSLDFGDSSKLTFSTGAAGAGGQISAIAGSDGTTFSLTQGTSGNQPTSVIRNGQITARFTSASNQYLTVLNSTGRSNTTTGYTMIAVVEFATNAASQAIVECGARSAALGQNRDVLLVSTTTGYNFRHNDGAAASSTASQGTSFTTALHLLVGRVPAGTTALTGKVNVDGTATTVVAGGTATSTISTDTFTVGISRNGNTTSLPLDGWLTRVWTFNVELSDAQIEQFATALATQYGSPNVA